MQESILLVDDEETILDSIGSILKKDGYRVACAKSAPEALDFLQGGPFDLIITDLSMPGMNGMELIERVSSLTPRPSIIMFTAHGSLETALMAQHRGVCNYLMKPVKISDLRQAIRSALDAGAKQAEPGSGAEGRTKQLLDYVTLACDFTTTLNASLDVRDILTTTLDRLKTIAETEAVSLALFMPAISRLFYLRNFQDSSLWDGNDGLSDELLHAGLRLDAPVHAPADAGFDGLPGEIREKISAAMERGGVRSAVLLPIRVKGETIGMADVRRFDDRLFTEIDLLIFKTIVNHASLALTKALTYREVEERRREITLLHNLGVKLNQSLKTNDSIRAICEGAVDITGSTGVLLQTSLEPGVLSNYVFNKQLGMHKIIKRTAQDWLITAGARRTTFFTNDPLVDDRINSLETRALGITSLAYVPLIYEWEDMGGLVVFHKDGDRQFEDGDLDLLHLFARHAAEVLLNSHLYESVKRSREKIITEKNKMDIVLSTMTDGVLTVDRDSKITFVNEALCALTGRSGAELIGRRCAELFPVEHCLDACPLDDQAAGASSGGHRTLETFVTSRSGKMTNVSISIAPLRDSEGTGIGWIHVVRDLALLCRSDRSEEGQLRAAAPGIRDSLDSMNKCVQVLKQDAPAEQRDECVARLAAGLRDIADALARRSDPAGAPKSAALAPDSPGLDAGAAGRGRMTSVQGGI